MSTKAQKQANRSNAQKSTGPRTAEGKTRSAQNARRHAFTASAFAVVRLEDAEEVAHLRADLVAVYQPVNPQELYSSALRPPRNRPLHRRLGRPSTLSKPSASINEELTHNLEVTSAQKRNYALAHGFHRIVQAANTWSLCLRYQALADRNYRRALEDFEKLKALRGELPNKPNFDPQPEPNTTTSTPFPVNPITSP